MGEIADYLIDQMIDDGYYPGGNFLPRGGSRYRNGHSSCAPRPKKVKTYPESTFDMGWFPTVTKKEEPNIIEELLKEDPPF